MYFSDLANNISAGGSGTVFLLRLPACGTGLSSVSGSLGLGAPLWPARAVGQLESGSPGTLSALVAPPSLVVKTVFNSRFHYKQLNVIFY